MDFSITLTLIAVLSVYFKTLAKSRTLQPQPGDTYGYCETSGHSIEVIGMLTHGHDFGDYCITRPLNPKYLRQLLEILGCCISYRKDSIAKPAHAKLTQFLVKELHTELTG